MKFHRIYALCLRYFYFARLDNLCDLLFWPALDIALWGMTSLWLQHQEAGPSTVVVAILTALLFLADFMEVQLRDLRQHPAGAVESQHGKSLFDAIKTLGMGRCLDGCGNC